MGLGRPGGCKGKDGYQGDADALPWHKTLLSRNRNFGKATYRLYRFCQPLGRLRAGVNTGGQEVRPAYLGLSKNQRLTELCRKIDARSGCGDTRSKRNAEMKTLDKTEQSDRVPNPNEKPESCYCSALPKGSSLCLPCYTRWLDGQARVTGSPRLAERPRPGI